MLCGSVSIAVGRGGEENEDQDGRTPCSSTSMLSWRAGIRSGRLARAVSRLSRQRFWYSSSWSLWAPVTRLAFSWNKKYSPALTVPHVMRL